jgi:hypothetical protein
MSVCRLLDLFNKNLELSAAFVLSMCTVTAENPTIGNENVLLDCFGVEGRGVAENSTKKVHLRVSSGKMKLCSYVQVEKNSYPQDVS